MDHYSVQAIRRERAFFRRAGPTLVFRTGTGRQNIFNCEAAGIFQSVFVKGDGQVRL